MSQPFFLNMTPGFSVKFVINRITANYKIQITNTTDYSGVATAYGFYRIEYPDGIFSENTNPSSPDFQIGQNLSEFNLRMINGKPATGQFKITQKTYANTGYFSGEKTFVFSFVEPELKLVDSSNLASPTVSFTDATNYNLGAYTEDITRLIVSNFPATLPFSSTVVTSIGSVLNMVYSGNYYEGVYNPNLSASVVLTGTDHTIEWTKSASFTFDVRKLLTYVELLSYLDVAKARYDQAKGTTNESKERENYQLVASIVEHIKLKSTITNQGIAELMFEVQDIIYKITCTFTDNYVYSVNPLVPIDESFFTEGVPLSRTLTINGVSYDLTQDRTWNVGTVTSVNIQVPTWMTVSGGPITQSGSFQLGLASGYYIPTTADVARWDIDTFVTGVSVTGTSVKTISLTRNDGVVLTAQWNDIDTFPVTSVNGKTGDVVLVTGDIAEGGSPANLWFTQARARSSVSLTTTGNSGAATYSSTTGVFNIPNYTLEGLGGVPLTRQLTINGVSYDLTQDRTWNVGTVTSVNIQVPIWMTVSGGPITQSGSFQLGLASGYYIPTTADVARWDIDTFVTGVSVTGTSVKTISLTRNDGVVLTAQWNDIDTFPVTSVNGKTGDVVLVTGDIAEGGSPANLWFTQARARSSVSLTTTGNSGAATYSSTTGVFNIPNYTLEGLGGVPLTRQLTINGATFDLSANRSWTIQVGHTVQNNGTVMTQRDVLNFVRMTVTDDSVNGRTTVTRPPSVTISLTPPTANVLEGDEWINSETWSKYAWYDGYWVQVNKKCGVGIGGGSPELGFGLHYLDGKIRLGTEGGDNYTILNMSKPGVGTSSNEFNIYAIESLKYSADIQFFHEKNIPNNYWYAKNDIIIQSRSNLNSSNRVTSLLYQRAGTAVSSAGGAFVSTRVGASIVGGAASGDMFLDFYSDLSGDFNEGFHGVKLVDVRYGRGIYYAGDYEVNFIPRSLVTKQYVDSKYLAAKHRENNTVLFDNDYVTGINGSARSGNILFDFTGAQLGACTMMRHQSGSAFLIPSEAVLMFDSADISTTVANYFMFSIVKIDSPQIVHVFHAIEGGV
jgi:hypothetical protein